MDILPLTAGQKLRLGLVIMVFMKQKPFLMEDFMMEGRFALGQTVSTRNAVDTLNPEDVFLALRRHASGDWGDCCPEDWQSNEGALRDGERLFSVYHDRNGVKFWIITEWDRSVTTILLPEDY